MKNIPVVSTAGGARVERVTGGSLLLRKVAPSLFWYALLIASALGLDHVLHQLGLYWVGRYLGILGTALILLSFVYSLRKRRLIARGSPKTLLDRHEFLAAADREDCASCHAEKKPADRLHEAAGSSCAACHKTSGWSPAAFDHARLNASGASCVSCHQSRMPADDLHKQVTGDCRDCHSTEAWKPASFEHSRYFRFDRQHPSDCSACHTQAGTFKTYSCYGCHEHSPAKIAAEHREEGITDFDDCVRCHRGGEEGEGERGKGGRSEAGREEDDH